MKNFKSFLLNLVILINGIQLSIFTDSEEKYNLLRYIIYFICFLLVLFSISSKKSLAKVHYAVLFIFTINFVFVTYMKISINEKIFISPFVNISYAALVFYIGFNLPNDIDLKKLAIFYIFITVCVGLLYLAKDGFVISEYYGAVNNKNQFGVNIGVAFLLSLYFTFHRLPRNYLMASLALLLLIEIIIFRTRTVLISCLILGLILMFNSMRSEKYMYLPLILLLVYVFLGNLILESITLNFDRSDFNSLSSGRVDLVEMGIESILNNIYFGKSLSPFLLDLEIHNFLINTIFYLGVCLSFGVLLVYAFLFYISVQYIYKMRKNDFGIGFILMFLIFVSFSEYSYPFSPLSSVFLPFVLLGAQQYKSKYFFLS